MRWLFVAAVVGLSSPTIYASETGTDESPSLIDGSEVEPGVIVSAIPSPPLVIQVSKREGPVARLHSGKKLRLAKKKALPTLMLTRTERRQVQLLVAHKKSDGHQGQSYNHNDESQTGLDELDLHRSYSRPKVAADSNDAEADTPGLSDYVRLRLLIAHLKAEAPGLSQFLNTDEVLTESVLRRLREARMKAVLAHQKRFT